MVAHRGGERLTDRAPVGHREHGSDHDVAGVVIDAGDHLAFAPVGQVDPADDVDLPQVHRCLALPAPVFAFMPLLLRLDQPIADQGPVHRRPGRHPLHAALPELEHQPPRTPTGDGPGAAHRPAPRPRPGCVAGWNEGAGTCPVTRPRRCARSGPSTGTPTAAMPRNELRPRPLERRRAPPTLSAADARPARSDPRVLLDQPSRSRSTSSIDHRCAEYKPTHMSRDFTPQRRHRWRWRDGPGLATGVAPEPPCCSPQASRARS